VKFKKAPTVRQVAGLLNASVCCCIVVIPGCL